MRTNFTPNFGDLRMARCCESLQLPLFWFLINKIGGTHKNITDALKPMIHPGSLSPGFRTKPYREDGWEAGGFGTIELTAVYKYQ